jgi:hypothetical protein
LSDATGHVEVAACADGVLLVAVMPIPLWDWGVRVVPDAPVRDARGGTHEDEHAGRGR